MRAQLTRDSPSQVSQEVCLEGDSMSHRVETLSITHSSRLVPGIRRLIIGEVATKEKKLKALLSSLGSEHPRVSQAQRYTKEETVLQFYSSPLLPQFSF